MPSHQCSAGERSPPEGAALLREKLVNWETYLHEQAQRLGFTDIVIEFEVPVDPVV